MNRSVHMNNMSLDIFLIVPKVLDQLREDTTFTPNLFYVPSFFFFFKENKTSFLLIVSIHSKGLEVNVMVKSGNFWYAAQNPALHSLGEASYRSSSQPRTPFPHSSKFKQRLPSLGQRTSCCLPAGDVWFFFWSPFFFLNPEISYLSRERQRHLLFGHQQLTAYVAYTHTLKANQNCI